ncbi:HTH domain-containing protein [Aerococcus urinae]
MNSRQLKLLKSMLSEHSYQSASYYAKRMSVSARTIYSDLDIINEFIKKMEEKSKENHQQELKLLEIYL